MRAHRHSGLDPESTGRDAQRTVIANLTRNPEGRMDPIILASGAISTVRGAASMSFRAKRGIYTPATPPVILDQVQNDRQLRSKASSPVTTRTCTTQNTAHVPMKRSTAAHIHRC